VAKARAAAGEKNVLVMGGGDILRQSLDAGIVDELSLTIAPVLLGAGKRLFDGMRRADISFERTGVIESPWATHIRYRVG
jgi:dihydrofolate reductase